jgi:hypothetical protein
MVSYPCRAEYALYIEDLGRDHAALTSQSLLKCRIPIDAYFSSRRVCCTLVLKRWARQWGSRRPISLKRYWIRSRNPWRSASSMCGNGEKTAVVVRSSKRVETGKVTHEDGDLELIKGGREGGRPSLDDGEVVT